MTLENVTLDNFDIEDFLSSYWQQKPLLIKGGLKDFEFPLLPDELAGLACEEDIESRLIIGDTQQGFSLQSGPFVDDTFNELPQENWTLLVQAVDHYLPEVAALLEYFRFIPNWRIDDVMVSYATHGGSVGPHYDNYDVFLAQGYGARRWKLGQLCDESTALDESSGLKLVENFECQEEWLLETGDILYLPPRYAHWGTGEGEHCMTYSVGFRAPGYSEILSHFCDDQLAKFSDFKRFTDPNLTLPANPGQIDEQALEQIQSILKGFVEDKAAIAAWFGRYMTEPKYPELHEEEPEAFEDHELDILLAESEFLYRNPSSRFAFSKEEDTLTLYVDGKSRLCSGAEAELAEWLCKESALVVEELPFRLRDTALLRDLFNQGALYIDDLDD